MLERLQELDLLSAIHPSLKWSKEYEPVLGRALHDEIKPEWRTIEKNGAINKSSLPENLGGLPLHQGLAVLVWLTQFPLEDALSISQRLRLPNDLVDCLPAAKKLKEDLPSLMEASPSQLTARMEQAPLATLYALSLI